MRRRLLPPLVLLALALVLVPASLAAAAAPRPRIVGGTGATPGAFPSIAALVVPGFAHDIDGQFCGGTVIAPYAILTAAHCIVQEQPVGPPVVLTPADFVVVTGSNDLSGTAGHRAVRAIATNALFDPATFDHDIAVILLQAPTPAAATPRPGAAPPGLGATGTVYGWGSIDATPVATSFPAQLRTASLPILNMGDCTNATMICAGTGTVSTPAPNVCVGDSGGPLVSSGGVLIGVTSSILVPTGAPGMCGFDSAQFTDVFAEQSWIDSQLKPTVSAPTMSVLPGGKLHVAWQLVPGGADPAVSVFTSNDPLHPRVAAAGATSLDITGLPAFTPLTVSVRVQNAWGTSQAPVPGTVTLAGAPGITGVAVAKGAVGAQVVTNGAATTVTAQYGLDTTHLTTSPAVALADAATAQQVSIPLTGLKPASTYRVRLVAQSTGGTATSAWLTLATPAVKPVARALPKLRGTARVGRTLSCTAGSWTAAPAPAFSYRWRIGTKVSARYTTTKLKLTTAMAGKKVSCVVTARNVAGRVTARSTAVTVRRR